MSLPNKRFMSQARQTRHSCRLQATGSMGKHLPEKIPNRSAGGGSARVSTKFLKLKQSITREKLNRNPQKGRLSLRQDLKGKTSKKSKSTQSESKATKKPAVIKELEKHFEKSEITVHCLVEISKGNDPKGDLNHHIGKHFTKGMKAFALPVLEGKKK